MASQELVLAPESGASVTDVQDEIAALWSELRNPKSASHAELSRFLADQGIDSTPENFLAPDASSDLSVRQAEENFDPTAGILIVAAWLGKKLADKVFDEFWKRVVVPRLDKRWGQGAVKPRG